ncbi:MAG: TolC family protein [Niabella sp.]
MNFVIEKSGLSNAQSQIPDKESVFAAAQQTLPDLQIYDLQKDVLNKELQIAKAAMKPTVSLSAGLSTGYTNTMDYTFFTQMHRNFNKQAGLSVSVPIFSRKENKTNIKLANINIEQNNLDKIAAAKTLYANIETAWQNAIANQTQQKSAKIARDNAKLAYDLAHTKYEFGGLTPTDLAVSRNTYLNAEQTYLQSKYMAVLYEQLLNYYQGYTAP